MHYRRVCEHLDGFRTLVKHDCTGRQKEPNAQDIIQEVEEMLRIRRIECMRVDFWRIWVMSSTEHRWGGALEIWPIQKTGRVVIVIWPR